MIYLGDLLCSPKVLRDIQGIVVVDEIDLHLHAIHQHEILPALVKMFPRVQFIVTTHSPLFVLGMEKTFGKDGFALYRLPQGEQIDPEEFSEFGSAYKSFKATQKFSKDIQKAIEKSQKPILFMEGATDILYLRKAAELLNKVEFINRFEMRDGYGFGNLDKISKHFNSKLAEITPQKIVLLYDCDKPHTTSEGNVFQRNIPKQENHPIKKGIENLFSLSTLEKAINCESAFIDIDDKRGSTKRGEKITIPEKWTVNKDEKTNLCNWLRQNGTQEDFQHFQVIFNLLEAVLNDVSADSQQAPQGKN